MFEKIKLQLSEKSVISGYAIPTQISKKEIADLSGSWKTPPGTLCKAGSSTVAYICNDKFFKCSPAGKLKRALRKMFQIPRPIRSMRMADKLKSIGVSTPQVFCAVREKHCGIPVCDYLVTELLDTSKVFFADKCRNFSFETQQQLFYSCAKLLKKMHLNHICHGDASLRNFYFYDQLCNTEPGVIDLDGCGTVFFLTEKKVFLKEDARFISSFIICCGRSEEPSQVEELCRFYIENFKTESPDQKYIFRTLVKLTMRYLVRTRR